MAGAQEVREGHHVDWASKETSGAAGAELVTAEARTGAPHEKGGAPAVGRGEEQGEDREGPPWPLGGVWKLAWG